MWRVLACFLSALSVLTVAQPAWGQQNSAFRCGGTQAIYFGNGVDVASEKDAASTFSDLMADLADRMPANEYDNTHFSLAYNKSHGLRDDLLEAVRQILGTEYPTLLIGYLLRLGDIPGFLIPASLKTALNDALRNDWAQKLIHGETSTTDVDKHVSNYMADIARGRKVVVVSHSQGNIFVNLAFEKLTGEQQASFAMVPVASPDRVIRKSLVGHVTFVNDLVIDLVQLLRLAAGLDLAPFPNDLAQTPSTWYGHNFSDDYLNDNSANDFVVDGTLRSLSSLPTPPTNACSSVSLDVHPLSNRMSLDGWPVFFSGTVKNSTNVDQRDLVVQSWITQGARKVAAGGGLLVPTGWTGDTSALGLVRATSTLTLDLFYSQANPGAAKSAGMVTGPAVLTIELRQFVNGVQTVKDGQSFDIVLDRSPTSMALARPQAGSWKVSPQLLYVVSYGSTVIYYSMVNTYDGSTPSDPSSPHPGAHDGVIVGPADGFTLYANPGQFKRSKLRFVGCSAKGCGSVSPVFEYRLDLR